MPCPPSVPISIIPPTGQGQGPLVWQNGNQVNRLNTPLNPSFFVYDGSKAYWADGSAQLPLYLPNLQQITPNNTTYLVARNSSGQLAYVSSSPYITNPATLSANQTFTGVNTFTQDIIGNLNGNSLSSTNLAGGAAGKIPYQAANSITAFTGIGTPGQILQSNGGSSPNWVNQSSIAAGTATTATNLASGAAGSIPFQTGFGVTTQLGIGTAGQALVVNAGATAPVWSSSFAGNAASATTATTATNIYNGAAGSLPYQTAASTTTTLPIGTANQLLTVNSGATAPIWQTGIKGVTDGSSAASGFVGEWVYSNIPSASAVTLTTTGTVYQITSISLTAGDWDVSASVNIHLSSTTMTTGRGGISTANNALTVPSTSTTNVASNSYDTFASLISTSNASSQSTTLGLGGDLLLATKTSRVNLSGTVTLYLVATAAFTGTAPTAYGTIEARRMR